MANGHGGARPGTGRKRKVLSEKIIDGNPGKAQLTIAGIMEHIDEAGVQRHQQSDARRRYATGCRIPETGYQEFKS